MHPQQVKAVIAGVFGLLVLCISGTWLFAAEPDNATDFITTTAKFSFKTDSKGTICSAYSTLLSHSPHHRHSPPLLYTLFSVPIPPAKFASKADRLAHRGAIIAGVSSKLSPLYEAKKYQDVEAELRVWKELGAVLLSSQVRDVYDRDVVRKKGSVGDKLRGVCGKGWASKNLN